MFMQQVQKGEKFWIEFFSETNTNKTFSFYSTGWNFENKVATINQYCYESSLSGVFIVAIRKKKIFSESSDSSRLGILLSEKEIETIFSSIIKFSSSRWKIHFLVFTLWRIFCRENLRDASWSLHGIEGKHLQHKSRVWHNFVTQDVSDNFSSISNCHSHGAL